MPGKPELEKEDISTHHDAIHAFALFLARQRAPLRRVCRGNRARRRRVDEVEGLARKRAATNRRWLTQSLDSHLKDKNLATTRVATEQISNAQSAVASNASDVVKL